jgi:hypothetical protein
VRRPWWASWCFVLASCAPRSEPVARASVSPGGTPTPPFESPIILASPLDAERVSLVRILADPNVLDGTPVRVGGYMHLEFEGNKLCLHRDDVEFMIWTNCVWLDVPNDPQLKTINDRYVFVEGVVTANSHGHLGMYPASIRGVTAVGATPTKTALDRWFKDQRP